MKILTTPISDEQIESLRIGDTVYLNGTIVTMRDDGHKRYLSGILPNLDLANLAVYHAGPIMKKENNEYKVISAGPTTSGRMESVENVFLQKSKVKMLIGKGGMGEKTAKACKQERAIHCVYCGGCGAIAADSIKEVKDVEWEDLGMPEALWIFNVENFGPLIVSIDTEGNNLFADNKKEFEVKKEIAKNTLRSYYQNKH